MTPTRLLRVFLPLLLYCTIIVGEEIGHECGLALVRLRKPLDYYQNFYGDSRWGIDALCTLIEEQRNRGQDGAGIAVMKFDMPPGELYLRRTRFAGQDAVDKLLHAVLTQLELTSTYGHDIATLKHDVEFLGEIYLGHVRYGTYAQNNLLCCQPYICKNSVASKTFALAGNFNMSNARELCEQLVEYGLCPTSESDTQVILELISYYLAEEHTRQEIICSAVHAKERADTIAQNIDIVSVLGKASASWDGGYVFAGILGNGDTFICRDPAGIRPGFFYIGDDVIAAASERTALAHAFSIEPEQIQELKPAHVLVIKKDGQYYESQFTEPIALRRCSFERIYFSRSNDPAIYEERKALGKNLAPRVLDALDNNLEQVIFTYVPNSSESAFIGLIAELNQLVRQQKIITGTDGVRVEKLIHKNQRLRTFIANDNNRHNLVARLYSMTKGIVKPEHTLVVLDDSIVRGTTLRKSIIAELIALNPKRIIFVSSAPPVMYPDCYGIDMSQIGHFIAFQAAIALLKEQGQKSIIADINALCMAQKNMHPSCISNYVQKLYEAFTLEELSVKIAELVRPADTLKWHGKIDIIYQTIDGLHAAMPDYSGDWYFTGNYPTPGGYKVLNTSYMQWYQGLETRAY
jgi:amidophosphoribosyltransferase